MGREPEAPSAGSERRIGTYRVVNRLALGGMAEVYRAMEPRAVGEERMVIIKRMLPDLAADDESREMFEHEIRLGLQIRHHNVVSVLDSGADDGVPYLVLEYIFGVDLWRLARQVRAASKRLPVPLALHIACELLKGPRSGALGKERGRIAAPTSFIGM